jgi:hypothetical protein
VKILCKKTVSRWIKIATVQRKFVVIRNWGVPGGLRVHWQGRGHVFQCTEFVNWGDLLPFIESRLRIAKLEMVALASVIPEGEHPQYLEIEMRCLVRRRSAIRTRALSR